MRHELPLLTALLACAGTTALANPIVIDDSDGTPDYTETGPMGDSVNVSPTNSYNGTARTPSIPAGTGPTTGTWTFTGLGVGIYDVAAHWSGIGPAGNLNPNAPYEIVSDVETLNVTANQQAASTADYLVEDDNNNPHEFEVIGVIEVGVGGQIALTLTGGVSPNPPDLEFEYYDAALVNAYTVGDLDLDGDVDIDDLGILAGNWQQSIDGVRNGDLDGDTDVDIDDLGLLAANWQVGVDNDPQGALPDFDAAVASVGIAVPEPASLALLALGGLVLARRRRA